MFKLLCYCNKIFSTFRRKSSKDLSGSKHSSPVQKPDHQKLHGYVETLRSSSCIVICDDAAVNICSGLGTKTHLDLEKDHSSLDILVVVSLHFTTCRSAHIQVT